MQGRVEREGTDAGGSITGVLARLRAGDRSAAESLYERLYSELRQLARMRLARLRPGQTLNTTALVHETYLKLVDQTGVDWRDRAHFMAVSSQAMRHILVDRARYVGAKKRGGGALQVATDGEGISAPERAAEVLALDEALGRLAALEPKLAQTVELRFFGGLSVDETAEVLGVSPRTVKRNWRKARALLYRDLGRL